MNYQKVIWMLYGQGGRLIFQTLYFLILASLMGPEVYGLIVTVASIILILGPFCGIGFNSLITRELSIKSNQFSDVYGVGIKLTIFSFIFLLLLGESIIFLIYNSSEYLYTAMILYLFLSIADLLLLKLNEMSSQIYIATGQVKKAAHILTAISFVRFLSVSMLFMYGSLSLINWVVTYFVLSLILSVFILIKVYKDEFIPNLSANIKWNSIKEGVYFSIGLSSQGVYNDVDKTILGKYQSNYDTGQYGFSYKLLDVLFVPIKAILALTFPKFFKQGKELGMKGTNKLAYKYLLPLLMYCLIISIISCFTLPMIIESLFTDYIDSIKYFYLLIPILFLKTTHYLIADSITGAGYQKERSLVQVGVAILNFILCLIFIIKYGVYGAILASIVSDFVMLISIFILSRKLLKKENKSNEEIN